MPYIDRNRRKELDESIDNLISALSNKEKLDNEEFVQILGDLNYCFSRILSNLMSDASYSKIAMITGVLENIKQEYYRRIAEPYEDQKINQNGDIKEYSEK